MYYKIEGKNTTIGFGLQYNKQAKLFLCKCYYKKQAAQIGTLSTIRDLTVAILYANKRIKILTHLHRAIKQRIV